MLADFAKSEIIFSKKLESLKTVVDWEVKTLYRWQDIA
jgi:hypothetical protein